MADRRYSQSSRGSVGSLMVMRSQSWSEEIAKTWNFCEDDSREARIERYLTLFTLTKAQLIGMHTALLGELKLGLDLHTSMASERSACSLKMLDSCIPAVPTGQELGTSYSLDFGGTTLRIVRAKLEGAGRVTTVAESMNLRKLLTDKYKHGLLDRSATAMELFDRIAVHTKKFDPHVGGDLGFCFCFPASQKSINSATLIHWTKEFATGRSTDDPVEGNDVAALLSAAFTRNEINMQVTAVVNDTTAALLSCAYEKPRHLPACTIGFICGTGINGAYVEPNAHSYGYRGVVVNTELGNFNKCLPINDIDMEIDFADCHGRGTQLFEKMIAAGYLNEICRRSVIRVWQSEAPALVWASHSMGTAACAHIIMDTSSDLNVVDKILSACWEWDVNLEDRKEMQSLFTMVFDRSAGLTAVALAGLAEKTGRLQAAMGGVSIGIDGSLYVYNKFYGERIEYYLDIILGEKAKLIHLLISDDGSGKGAAIAAATCRREMAKK